MEPELQRTGTTTSLAARNCHWGVSRQGSAAARFPGDTGAVLSRAPTIRQDEDVGGRAVDEEAAPLQLES